MDTWTLEELTAGGRPAPVHFSPAELRRWARCLAASEADPTCAEPVVRWTAAQIRARWPDGYYEPALLARARVSSRVCVGGG